MKHGYRLIVLLLLMVLAQPAVAADPPRPFGLPFADPPGPNSWYLGQLYGNTTGAYNQRDIIYRAGQGLHFGVVFTPAPCSALSGRRTLDTFSPPRRKGREAVEDKTWRSWRLGGSN